MENREPRIAVLTAITQIKKIGLSDPILSEVHEGVDYYAFTDKHYENCNVWNQIPLTEHSIIDARFGERRNAKLPKVLGFFLVPGYDYYIWHDSYQEVRTHPKQIIEEVLKDNDIALFKHTDRDCCYDEIEKVKELNFDHHQRCDELSNFLIDKNFPNNKGLFDMTCFMYRNNSDVQAMMLAWWEMICRFSSRDQCSFPYVLETHGIKHSIFKGNPARKNGNNKFIPNVRCKLTGKHFYIRTQ
jgi:hypothetical protein